MPNKTKIEWCDYSINPIKGLCPMDCKGNQGQSYCYARRMYKRFKWNPEITMDFDSFLPLASTIKIKPSKVFVGSTMELFGEWVKSKWIDFIFQQVRIMPEHTFIFLTKRPENLIKWSPFPENCWIGVSATSNYDFINRVGLLAMTKARVKFVSFEPLLQWDDGILSEINIKYIPLVQWLIIGQQTPVKASTTPKIEWLREIVDAADAAKIPVFLKNNLQSVFLQQKNYEDGFFIPKWAGNQTSSSIRNLRQEFPKPIQVKHGVPEEATF